MLFYYIHPFTSFVHEWPKGILFAEFQVFHEVLHCKDLLMSYCSVRYHHLCSTVVKDRNTVWEEKMILDVDPTC